MVGGIMTREKEKKQSHLVQWQTSGSLTYFKTLNVSMSNRKFFLFFLFFFLKIILNAHKNAYTEWEWLLWFTKRQMMCARNDVAYFSKPVCDCISQLTQQFINGFALNSQFLLYTFRDNASTLSFTGFYSKFMIFLSFSYMQLFAPLYERKKKICEK